MNLIENFGSEFEFLIVTRNTDYGVSLPYEGILPNIWISYNDYTRVLYLSKDKLNLKYIRSTIGCVEFDKVYINGIYSFYFSILPIVLLKKYSNPIIVSPRGMLNPQAFSVKKAKKRIFLKLAKFLKLYSGIVFHATNEDEAYNIGRYITGLSNIHVAPNLPRKIENYSNCIKPISFPVKFVNIARISIEKGTLKMLEALKLVDTPLVLDIYGSIYDQNYWDKCLRVIANLNQNVKVNYKGVLASEEVPKKLSTYDYFIMLSEGENFGHSIFEAFSVGLPVIISNRTPWKNLQDQNMGWDIDINDAKNVARVVTNAIQLNQDLYLKYSSNAYNFAKDFTKNSEIIELNRKLFLEP